MIKGKECSSGLLELNIVCAHGRGAVDDHGRNSQGSDDGTVVTYLKNCVEQ